MRICIAYAVEPWTLNIEACNTLLVFRLKRCCDLKPIRTAYSRKALIEYQVGQMVTLPIGYLLVCSLLLRGEQVKYRYVQWCGLFVDTWSQGRHKHSITFMSQASHLRQTSWYYLLKIRHQKTAERQIFSNAHNVFGQSLILLPQPMFLQRPSLLRRLFHIRHCSNYCQSMKHSRAKQSLIFEVRSFGEKTSEF